MEVDDVHECKFPRLERNNGKKMDEQYNQDEEEEGENKRGSAAVAAAAADLGGGIGRFYGWPSSRIVRVSRASGGKDRHSKVLTSKGLRDRRVRLSVNTAIQFYDLQDRLGCDQPSKAVEWLLKAAASSIDELPPINTPFPDTPRQVSDDKRSSTSDHQLGFDSAEVDMAPNYNQQQFTNPSACSSNSETSKGSSGLSLSRSESRIKARERAKERVAAEKDKEKDNVANLNPISQTTSFTELLSAGINGPNCSIHRNPRNGGGATNESLFFQKSPSRHWSSSTTPMDYFSTGLLGPQVTRQMNMANPALFSIDHQPELQQFSFVPDHLVSVVNSSNNNSNHNNGGSEYNLNFTISSSSSAGLAGYNRGTLQSNSPLPHHHHHLQRFHPPMDGTSSPQSTFFIGTTTPHVENNNHHPFLSGYDSRLQLCYGDNNHSNNGNKPSGQKGKGKS